MTRIYMTKNGKTIMQELKDKQVDRWTELAQKNGYKVGRVVRV
jgi:hypothetical protein